LGFLLKYLLEKESFLAWSSSILEILFDNSLIILAMSSILSFTDLPDPECPAYSLKRLVSLAPILTLFFIFPDAIIFDSILMESSYILVRSVDLLSLKRRENLGSKAPAKVTLVPGWEGLTSAGIL
jgi:hypothetical protein